VRYEEEPTPYECFHQPSDEVNELARRVIGAMIAVHTELGSGQPEEAYENALAIELTERGIPFLRQFCFDITYHGQVVARGRLDFLVDDMLILELKSIDAISPAHRRRVIQYLRMTKKQLGLLVNFNVNALKDGIVRIILSKL
jgi:GxxExxY protein